MRARASLVTACLVLSATLGVWVAFAQTRIPLQDSNRTMGAAAADAVLEGYINSNSVKISDLQRQVDDLKEQETRNMTIITQLGTENAQTQGRSSNNSLWLVILAVAFSGVSAYNVIKSRQTAPEVVSEQSTLKEQMRDLTFTLNAFLQLSPAIRMQREYARELHADDQPVTDRLLERLIAGTLTPGERTSLEIWLHSHPKDRNASGQKSASNLLDIMKRVENEEKTKLPNEPPKETEIGK